MASRAETALELYRRMARSRAFEERVAELWDAGRISGEMHLGTGEEGIAAGVTFHLDERDAVALDHRCSPILCMLGVPLRPLLAEVLGHEDGCAGGRAGHMHLMSRPHLAAASGIVGASAPLATGFALAATKLRPGGVAVAFFGEGAANQGMVLEALNLASAWKLPVLFVCKDNGWAITTRSSRMTGGELVPRAAAMGLEAERVDGLDALAVERVAGRLLARIRKGRGPAFLLATCSRLDAHFLGDPLLRTARHPIREGKDTLRGVVSGATALSGGGLTSRLRGLSHLSGTLRRVRKDSRGGRRDPLVLARKRWRRHRKELALVDAEIAAEMRELFAELEEPAP